MTYEINEEYQAITIEDSNVNNIRLWLDCLDQEVMHGIFQREFNKQIDNLERISYSSIDTTASTMYDRIYFQRDKILYRPNASGEERDFLWPLLKKKFERTRKLYEEKVNDSE